MHRPPRTVLASRKDRLAVFTASSHTIRLLLCTIDDGERASHDEDGPPAGAGGG